MEGVVDDEETQMQALMGFGGFGTTKQKKVRGNDVGGVYKNKPTKYRQYMYVLFIPPLFLWGLSSMLTLV